MKLSEDKVARSYPGPSPAFLRAMHSASADKSPLVVLRALQGGEPVAGVLVLRHGRAATYQVGWTSERGRAVRAHHFLLWQSVLWLVNHGYTGFDLGGINEKTPGIARFKTRMGGKPFRLAGGFV